MVTSTPRWTAIAAALALLVIAVPASAQVDLTGHWVKPGGEDHAGEANIGDYTGLPLNEAGRIKADSWTYERWGMPEHTCEPHPSTYAPIGPANLRIMPIIDQQTQDIVAWDVLISWMEMHRVIWMDGRPHPPSWTPHTWMGFSTGKWEGDQLTVTTTHLKAAWIRRNGAPHSDQAVMREHFVRNGNTLTLIWIVNDPVYLTEPLIRTLEWELTTGSQIGSYPCDISVEVDRERGYVPHHLPGQNPYLKEFGTKNRLPLESVRGGAETMRPEYAATIRRRFTQQGAAAPAGGRE